MPKKLYILDDDGGGTVSVVDATMEGDIVLCEIELSDVAAKAYDVIDRLRFGGPESPFFHLLDEVARAAYAAKKCDSSH